MPDHVESPIEPKKTTLDVVRNAIGQQLSPHFNRQGRYFRDEGELESFIDFSVHKAMKMGDYTYDPVIGQVNISFPPDLIITDRIAFDSHTGPKGPVIGQYLLEYFKRHGWDNVIVIPARTGVNRPFVNLQADVMILTGPSKESEALLGEVLRSAGEEENNFTKYVSIK